MLDRISHITMALCIILITTAVAATSSVQTITVQSANVSAPTLVPVAAPYHEPETGHDIIFSNVTVPDLVQIAENDFPHPEMMTKLWKGKATVELYMVSEVVNTVGNVTGSALYGAVYEILDMLCPPRIGINDHPSCYPSSASFPSRYRKDGGDTANSLNQIQVMSSKFASNEVRRPLIGAIAAAYEAMTSYDANCFRANDEAAGYRHCNVAIRTKAFTEDSWLSIKLTSDIEDDNDGAWHCCETRELIDAKFDSGVVSEFKNIYPTLRGKDRLVGCHMGCTDDQRSYKIDIDKVLIEVKDVQKW